jgi:hypothetical protein
LSYHIQSSKNAQQRPIITAVEDITRIGQISTPITITQTLSPSNMVSAHKIQITTRITMTETTAKEMKEPLN